MPVEPERLQKFLAGAGIASRRKCEAMIQRGRVRVNGQVVTERGLRVQPDVDRIEVDGKLVRGGQELRYYLLYKPQGYLTTMSDPQGRPVAVDLLPSRLRLYPVGRLDLQSEGLLLLTNDGALAQRLMHPRYGHEKEYLALIKGRLLTDDVKRLRQGIRIGDEERLATAEARSLPANWRWRGEQVPCGCRWVRLLLRQGLKRQIRYMLRALRIPVVRLIRVRQGALRLGNLEPGKGRWLTGQEIAALRRSVSL